MTIPFSLSHRTDPNFRKAYYEEALRSGKRVIYLSVMSQNSFKLLKKYLSPKTQLNVLTWNPKTESEVLSYAEHLQEGDTKLVQIKNSLTAWDEVSAMFPNVKVRTYSSTPTMQGVVVDHEYAFFELIPYATPPDERMALAFRYAEPNERPAYLLIKKSLEGLLQAAQPRVPGKQPDFS